MMVLPGGPCHPWLFVEESAGREVERDFSSVYSRLVLCRTFRLDEDGKVLTPEEVRLISFIANTIVKPRKEYCTYNFNFIIVLPKPKLQEATGNFTNAYISQNC